jgi:nitroreductase
VLEAAAASASAGNVQPWGFVLVQDPGRLRALRALAPGIIGEPTAVVAICLDMKRAEERGGAMGPKLAWMDIGLATQNALLAAHDLGLGACPIGSFHRQAVAVFLDLPAHVEPVLLIALGYPQAKPPVTGRRPLSEVCFAERWGEPL